MDCFLGHSRLCQLGGEFVPAHRVYMYTPPRPASSISTPFVQKSRGTDGNPRGKTSFCVVSSGFHAAASSGHRWASTVRYEEAMSIEGLHEGSRKPAHICSDCVMFTCFLSGPTQLLVAIPQLGSPHSILSVAITAATIDKPRP